MRSTPTEHRVSAHLGVDAATYDAAIRRFIPGYEAMIGQVISILDESLGERPLVVDLGAGTGALAGAILDGIPRARVVLVDIDPDMLAVAAARVGAHGDRAELRRTSFDDALPPCDAVVASLSLHHVPELERKRALYARIHAALRPGGVFLSADATVHEVGPEKERTFRAWAAGMARAGIAAAEAEALFAQWAGEDRYYPLAAELELLASAGFPRPECFWKLGASTVFGGFRGAAEAG
ncbi:MAG TPA: class I SAM-dependent methyltransferase [Kofleriaceae bacterium]|nr:class I SAM-dependent methyltransferase [Kofleriaceae bacterium]